jgi:uracil-DNA glycosylase family 4
LSVARRTAGPPPDLARLQREIVGCARCPRLRAHCEKVAREKRRMYRDEEYWGKPVPSFGDPRARLLLLGLAPGAHGANRTGRMFTGDRSGDFLYAALHRAGFASQAESVARDDGLRLRDAWISAVARCAPPGNRPTAAELAACRPFLEEELRLLPRVRAVLALGRIAFDGTLRLLRDEGALRRPLKGYPFRHGVSFAMPSGVRLFASYHPSQQNTQTGRLTAAMMDGLLRRVLRYLDG